MTVPTYHYREVFPHDYRMGIYLRDNLRCVFCQQGVADGVSLVLLRVDVKTPIRASNLDQFVTACLPCAWRVESTSLAMHLEHLHSEDDDATDIDEHYQHIRMQRALGVPMQTARYHVSPPAGWARRLIEHWEGRG